MTYLRPQAVFAIDDIRYHNHWAAKNRLVTLKRFGMGQFNRSNRNVKVTLDAELFQPELLPFTPGILLEHGHLG